MLAAGRDLAREDQARLLNRALADWVLSAGPASDQRGMVTCELRQHAGGYAAVVVAAGRREVLAWYRVIIGDHRVRLRREPLEELPSALLRPSPPGLLSRSAALRARSQALAGRSAQLRAQSAAAQTRLAQSRALLDAVRAHAAPPPAGPAGKQPAHRSQAQPQPGKAGALAPGR